MFLNIVMSNLHSIYNSALTSFYSRVTESREVALFPKDLGCYKWVKGREFWFQIAFFSLNPFL